MALGAVDSTGDLEHRAGRQRRPLRQPRLRVVSNSTVTSPAQTDRLIVRIAFVFDELVAAPHDQLGAPAVALGGRAAEESGPLRFELRPLTIGHGSRSGGEQLE